MGVHASLGAAIAPACGVNRKLGSWSALALDRKVELAPLFLPGITRAELLGAMGTSTLLDEVVREASALVTFWWLEGRMQETGELYFEIDDDNVYTLDPVEALASQPPRSRYSPGHDLEHDFVIVKAAWPVPSTAPAAAPAARRGAAAATPSTDRGDDSRS